MKAILINIFGGIVRCDRVAQGVIQAQQSMDIQIPVVVRLAGTNAELAAEMLNDSKLDFTVGTGPEGRGREGRDLGAMSILVDRSTRVFVQGITGSEGSFHTRQMIEYGTQVVGGSTPGKGGQEFEGLPVFNTVAQGAAETGADASVIFVPAPFAADAIMEAAAAGMATIACISEGIPVADMVRVREYLRDFPQTRTRRAELSGCDHSGGVQDGDHARVHIPAGQGGRHITFRHPSPTRRSVS